MTAKQVELIKRLISAERAYWRECLREARGEKATCPTRELKWVEVAGKFNGVDKRTAQSLQDAGLVEMMQGWSERQTVIWLQEPFDSDTRGKPLIEVIQDEEEP